MRIVQALCVSIRNNRSITSYSRPTTSQRLQGRFLTGRCLVIDGFCPFHSVINGFAPALHQGSLEMTHQYMTSSSSLQFIDKKAGQLFVRKTYINRRMCCCGKVYWNGSPRAIHQLSSDLCLLEELGVFHRYNDWNAFHCSLLLGRGPYWMCVL